MQKITPCLWFDDQAEAAAQFYTAVFKDSKIVNIAPMVKPGVRSTENRPGRSWSSCSNSRGRGIPR